MKYRKKLILMALIVFGTSLSGCGSSDDAVESLSYYEIQQQEKEEKAAHLEKIRTTKKEDLTKMYKDGLWKEDFSEVKKRLDQEFEAYLEDDLEPLTGIPLYVESENEYYNSALKTAQEENLSIEYMLENSAECIRNYKFNLYDFEDDFFEEAYEARIKEIQETFPKRDDQKILFKHYTFREKALDEKSGEEWELTPDAFRILVRNFFGKYHKKTADNVLEVLKNKYNEDFIFRYDLRSLSKNNDGFHVCQSVEDPEILFEDQITDTNSSLSKMDKYLAAVSQKYMYELIEEILVEEGLDDRVVSFTVPGGYDWTDIDNTPYDMSQVNTRDDVLTLLNDGFLGDYDINLIYMKDQDEEVDYEKVMAATKRIMDLINSGTKVSTDGKLRDNGFLYIYNLPEGDHEVVKYLFERDRITENYFRPMKSFYDLKNFWVKRVETDGFHYLDVFGAKEKEYWMVGEQDAITVEEFEKRYLE